MTAANRFPIWIVAALAGYCIFLFAPQVLNDGDTYLHIAAGKWSLQHGSVPDTDPFSYTFNGAPWVAHEWLSEVIMAFAYRMGSWSGLLILFGGVAALAFGLFSRHLCHWLPPLPATLVLILGGSCVADASCTSLHPCSSHSGMDCWAAFAWERGRVPWMLLPLVTLWANMHGSFAFQFA